jgi:hypothetical protein
MEKINIAELLKDCPSGMELNCTIFDNVSFVGLQDSSFPIIIHTPDGYKFLTHFGCYHNSCSAKCVIFPKGKTTWEGFTPPYEFKNGDVIVKNNFIAIISHIDPDGRIWYHCWYDTKYKACKIRTDFGIGCINDDDKIRLATKEEKEKLFQAIKDNGYKWDPETKTLEKLVEPQFKVGDKITNGKASITIGYIDNEYYYEICRNVANRLLIKNQDDWELVPDKFNITTLKPFAEVLVRNTNNGRWCGQFYMSYDKNEEYPFECVYNCWKQCIPFEGNEHLLGKTEECKDFYRNW